MNLAFRLAGVVPSGAARLPGSLEVNRRLSQWLRFRREGFVEAYTGKVELGQGIVTALAQIVADELDVDLHQVRMIPASTGCSPDEALTSGSLSIQESGNALRHACAEARRIYLLRAAERFDVPLEALTVSSGRIEGAGVATDYWSLVDDTLLDREATGSVPTKPAKDLRVIGRNVPRVDLPDKVFGTPRFIHDLTLPGMLHGRVLRPAGPGAVLETLAPAAAEAVPGVVGVVRDGSFVGVIAQTERAAGVALERLAEHARWRAGPDLPDASALGAWLKAQPAETDVVASKGEAHAAGAVRTVRAEYAKPFIAHASLAPSCAIARWREDTLEVWSHTQGIYNLRRDLALAFALPPEAVTAHHAEGAGCYGHNGADDVAFDAARLARAVPARSVRVQWSRADEFAWSPFGPAMHVALEADLDAQGAIVGWRHETWSNGHSTRPGRAQTPALLGSYDLERGFPPLVAINAPFLAGGGAERNSVPCYDFPAWQVTKHRVLEMPIRTSAMRALGAFANVFAIESFMDEIAGLTGADPVAFRLQHVSDPRAHEVIMRAAERAGWKSWQRKEGHGHGIAFARYKHVAAYCAVVAEIEALAEIRVRRLVLAVDVGQVVNPDGVVNQIEGGAIQAASWALKEAVAFDGSRITSTEWEHYPILRFSEVPEVVVEVIDHPELPSMGAGEAAMGPTAGAIANAVFDALGVRVRELPLTASRIEAAMAP